MNLTGTVDPDHGDSHERASHSSAEDLEPELDAETIEALAAQEDRLWIRK